MRNDRRAILSLVALGRITPSEAERLLIACNAGRDGFWIFAACVAATLFTLVTHQGLAALLHVSRVLLADDSLHHALSFIHHLLGGIQ
jgi:hypothetical protein